MKLRHSSVRSLTSLFALTGILVTIPTLKPAQAAAQTGGGIGGGIGGGSAGGVSTGVGATPQAPSPPPNVTLKLKDVPLRDALTMLFQSAHVQYSIAPDVPNMPVTLVTNDMDFEMALRSLLRLGSTEEDKSLTYMHYNGIWQVQLRSTPPAAPEQPRKIYTFGLTNVTAATAAAELKPILASSSATVVQSPNDNTLLVTGTEEEIGQIRMALVRAIDRPAPPITLRARVTFVPNQGNPREMFSARVITLQGQEAVIEEQSNGKTEQTSRFSLRVLPHRMSDGHVNVASNWDVLTPVNSGAGTSGTLLLEKRLQTSTNLLPGETAEVGTVSGDEWGGKGKLRMEITLEPASTPSKRS